MAIARPIPESYYYSGQGRLMMGERDINGRPMNMFAVGNVPTLEVSIAVTKTDHKEAMSGQRAIDLSLVNEKTPTFSMVLESLSIPNLVAAMWGEGADIEAGNVVDEPIFLKPGSIAALRFMGIKTLVLKTATGVGGTTLVEDGNYDHDPDYGTIYPLADAEDITDSGVLYYASYSYASHTRLDALMSAAPPERFLRFEGLNTINNDLVLVEIPRASFDPIQTRGLINDDVAQATIAGTILLDPKIKVGSPYYTERKLGANWAV